MPENEMEEGLLRAAVDLLRPLAHSLIANGVPFGRLEARLRELFIRMAALEFALEDRQQTDSRVSLLTGINRKEVRRVRASKPGEPRMSSFSRNQAAGLVSRWLTDRRAADAAGKPLPIPYLAKRGPSFVAFARKTTNDLPPRAILDELVRTGAVRLLDDGRVALEADAYVPRRGRSEKLAMLAEDPRELVETMLHNVLGDGEDTRLQRKVFYDHLGSDGLPKARNELRREAERFLRRVNRLLSRYDRDHTPDAPGGERRYAGVGIYYFEAPERGVLPQRSPEAAANRASKLKSPTSPPTLAGSQEGTSMRKDGRSARPPRVALPRSSNRLMKTRNRAPTPPSEDTNQGKRP